MRFENIKKAILYFSRNGDWPDSAVRLVTVLSNSTHARTQKLKIVEKMLGDVGIPSVNQVFLEIYTGRGSNSFLDLCPRSDQKIHRAGFKVNRGLFGNTSRSNCLFD